jgi:MscS family membrane protein
LISLRELCIQGTAFLALMGIAGLAVVLAAKTILSNALAVATLTADPNFRVGNRIKMGEHTGDVTAINLHKTVICTCNNEIVMILNDVLGKEVIVNHTLPKRRTRVELEIGVAHGTDLKRHHGVNGDHPESDRVVPNPSLEVNVASLGDNAVVLQVLARIDASRGNRAVRNATYQRALTRFAEAGIEILFPTVRGSDERWISGSQRATCPVSP